MGQFCRITMLDIKRGQLVQILHLTLRNPKAPNTYDEYSQLLRSLGILVNTQIDIIIFPKLQLTKLKRISAEPTREACLFETSAWIHVFCISFCGPVQLFGLFAYKSSWALFHSFPTLFLHSRKRIALVTWAGLPWSFSGFDYHSIRVGNGKLASIIISENALVTEKQYYWKSLAVFKFFQRKPDCEIYM